MLLPLNKTKASRAIKQVTSTCCSRRRSRHIIRTSETEGKSCRRQPFNSHILNAGCYLWSNTVALPSFNLNIVLAGHPRVMHVQLSALIAKNSGKQDCHAIQMRKHANKWIFGCVGNGTVERSFVFSGDCPSHRLLTWEKQGQLDSAKGMSRGAAVATEAHVVAGGGIVPTRRGCQTHRRKAAEKGRRRAGEGKKRRTV
jgi:hypothetical protein